MRRKAMSGPDGQLNRLRALNGAGNGSGAIGNILMSEYNPNYEFGGGTCTLQDLKEIPRENLRLVKLVTSFSLFDVFFLAKPNDAQFVIENALTDDEKKRASQKHFFSFLIFKRDWPRCIWRGVSRIFQKDSQ